MRQMINETILAIVMFHNEHMNIATIILLELLSP